MAEIRLSKRYAKSLLDIGKEKNILDTLYADMQLVAQVIRKNRAFAAMLKSPVIHSFKKDAVLKDIFGGKIHEASLEFMNMIVSNSREFYLEDIALAFIDLYKTHKNIQPATVTTAVAMDEKLRNEILEILKKSTGSTIDLKESVDPSIIGGFILRWGDHQIDSSVKTSLGSLKQDFRKTFV